MFWAFILVVAFAIGLIRLGMFSVWVSVLAGSLQLALLVIAIITIALIWRRVFGTAHRRGIACDRLIVAHTESR
jgi:hypothetical protein